MHDLMSKLPAIHEKGKLGISYLKRMWAMVRLEKENSNIKASLVNYNYATAVFDALGVGIEPAFRFLYSESTSFEKLEDWIMSHGEPSVMLIQLFNEALYKNQHARVQRYMGPKVLSDEMIQSWESNGYLIIKQAVPKSDCEATVSAIYDFIDASPQNPDSWYKQHPAKQGIMIQMFRSDHLVKNKTSPKIRDVYRQLWDRNDLFVSTDRVSFNPPEHAMYTFPGPNLHWDIPLVSPVPFGLQGLLYLADTAADQGAFTLVPGFHLKVNQWLQSLPDEVDPNQLDLHDLEPIPLAGEAGDFIVWQQALPHGSSPNTSTRPRLVQYINYRPLLSGAIE